MDTRAQNNGSQCTLSGQDDHLESLPVIFIGHINMRPEKKNKKTSSHYYVSRGQAYFFYIVFLLVKLVASWYYHIIFNVLTSS